MKQAQLPLEKPVRFSKRARLGLTIGAGLLIFLAVYWQLSSVVLKANSQALRLAGDVHLRISQGDIDGIYDDADPAL